MNVSLGKTWEKYVSEQVASGHFNNASEVVRDALRLQSEYQLKLTALKRDVLAGVAQIKARKVSRVSAADIIEESKARRSAK